MPTTPPHPDAAPRPPPAVADLWPLLDPLPWPVALLHPTERRVGFRNAALASLLVDAAGAGPPAGTAPDLLTALEAAVAQVGRDGRPLDLRGVAATVWQGAWRHGLFDAHLRAVGADGEPVEGVVVQVVAVVGGGPATDGEVPGDQADGVADEGPVDRLTGLVSRSDLLQRLEALVDGARRGRGDAALLFADVDDFALLNQAGGRAMGDQVLGLLASRFREVVGDRGLVARAGVDEFAVALHPPASEGDATALAAQLAEACAQPLPLDHTVVTTTASVGVALIAGRPGDTPARLLREAEAAMEQARAGGTGRVAVADQAFRAAMLRRAETASGLRQASREGEVTVHHQPIVRLGDGALVGVEALARWRHPQLGVVPTDEFIGVAEDVGLMHRIGRDVLRRALLEVAGLPPTIEGPPVVHVNMSTAQFRAGDVVEVVEAALREAGMPPERLCLELTESVLQQLHERQQPALHALRDLGVGLAVDDFGTGFSSLAFLRALEVRALKVDRSVIEGMATSADTLTVVRALIDLATAIGAEVVAEGVETQAQRRSLHRLGCAQGQGYLWARPMPIDELREWVVAHPTSRRTGHR